MIYIISRASACGSDNSPCKEASVFTHMDKEHGFQQYWSVQFDTLDDLMEFIAREGNIIIDKRHYNVDLPSITIYDGYVE